MRFTISILEALSDLIKTQDKNFYGHVCFRMRWHFRPKLSHYQCSKSIWKRTVYVCVFSLPFTTSMGFMLRLAVRTRIRQSDLLNSFRRRKKTRTTCMPRPRLYSEKTVSSIESCFKRQICLHLCTRVITTERYRFSFEKIFWQNRIRFLCRLHFFLQPGSVARSSRLNDGTAKRLMNHFSVRRFSHVFQFRARSVIMLLLLPFFLFSSVAFIQSPIACKFVRISSHLGFCWRRQRLEQRLLYFHINYISLYSCFCIP